MGIIVMQYVFVTCIFFFSEINLDESKINFHLTSKVITEANKHLTFGGIFYHQNERLYSYSKFNGYFQSYLRFWRINKSVSLLPR